MKFKELDEFKKDIKRLTKKYKSLNEDLALLKHVLVIKPEERPPFSFRINNGSSLNLCCYLYFIVFHRVIGYDEFKITMKSFIK